MKNSPTYENIKTKLILNELRKLKKKLIMMSWREFRSMLKRLQLAVEKFI